MKKLLFSISFFLILTVSHGYCQGVNDAYAPPTLIQKHFNEIKQIVQPDIIQLPDSVITFPLTGLTFIRVIPANQLSGSYTEIELWIIDKTEKVIYNNVIATDKNTGQFPIDAEYCRYMKLQVNYLLHQ